MKNPDNHTNSPGVAPGLTETSAKRSFVEPEISDPVEVVKDNPAANALFAVAGSGTLP